MNVDEDRQCQLILDKLNAISYSSDFDARNKEMFHTALLRCKELINHIDHMKQVLPNDLIDDYKYAIEQSYKLILWMSQPVQYETVKVWKQRLEK